MRDTLLRLDAEMNSRFPTPLLMKNELPKHLQDIVFKIAMASECLRRHFLNHPDNYLDDNKNSRLEFKRLLNYNIQNMHIFFLSLLAATLLSGCVANQTTQQSTAPTVSGYISVGAEKSFK